nr:MAG TPA: hypothetical protein [Caudoviricetes sp.]DAW33166.1 MAG TPA: hypothetical protein [Caudoviricetes sp.]
MRSLYHTFAYLSIVFSTFAYFSIYLYAKVWYNIS